MSSNPNSFFNEDDAVIPSKYKFIHLGIFSFGLVACIIENALNFVKPLTEFGK